MNVFVVISSLIFAGVIGAPETELSKSNTFVYEAGQPDQRCPRVDDPYRPIHMQHPYDCTKFYKCFDGRAYLIDCPAGLHWGPAVNRCDFPALARCERPYSLPVEASEKSNTFVYEAGVADVRCPRIDDPNRPIHMQHPFDCTKFYKCFDGRAYQISCPAGQEWGVAINRCDHPERAMCYRYSLPVEASEKSNTFSYEAGVVDQRCPRSENPYHTVHLSHPYDCTKFYKCYDGRAYAIKCPYGQQWGEALNRCDYPEKARCEYSASHSGAVDNHVNTFVYEAGVPDQRCPRIDDPRRPIHMQHPYDCARFYKCFDGKAYLINCPAGQEWSTALNRCDHPTVSQCRYRYSEDSKLIEIIKASSTEEENAKDETEQTAVAVAEEVSEVKGNILLPGVLLNEEQEREEMERRGVYDFRCPESDSPFEPLHLPHHSDCRKFYKCFAHRAFLITCPAAEHWSVELNRCEYPEFANCKIERKEN